MGIVLEILKIGAAVAVGLAGFLYFYQAKRRRDVAVAAIVAMGRSLGSGVAVHLAAHRQLAGVILVSPYDSVRALAQSIYPWLPVGLLLKHPFDSMSRAGDLAVALLCVCG